MPTGSRVRTNSLSPWGSGEEGVIIDSYRGQLCPGLKLVRLGPRSVWSFDIHALDLVSLPPEEPISVVEDVE